MSMIRPFRGLRPRKEFAHRIASLPYDVLDSDEARDIVEDNPLSFLRVVKPEVDLDPGVDLYSDEVFHQGAVNLRRLVEEGLMVQDTQPMLYFYRQIMGDHAQVGIVACVSAEEYDRDVIRKHEHTRKAKEEDRIRHIISHNAQAGPVFLTYRDIPGVDAIEKKTPRANRNSILWCPTGSGTRFGSSPTQVALPRSKAFSEPARRIYMWPMAITEAPQPPLWQKDAVRPTPATRGLRSTISSSP